MTTNDDLRREAEAATAGDWNDIYDDNGFYFIYAEFDGPSPYIVATGGEGNANEANARFIAAANPKRILALLDDLAAKDAEIARLREALELYEEASMPGKYQFCGHWEGYGELEPVCDCGFETGCKKIAEALGSAKP